jgi:hypothetical protein
VLKPAVFKHMTPAAKEPNVLCSIVSRITVPVMTLPESQPAPLTRATLGKQTLGASAASVLRYLISYPPRMLFATLVSQLGTSTFLSP